MAEEGRRLGRLELELNPSWLASIIDHTVIVSTEIVNFHLNALAKADLARPAEVADSRYQFNAPDVGAAARRAMHENWILAKAFQDLLRAVRHSLEEAHILVALLTGKHQIRSSASIAEFLQPFKRKAASLKFPALLDAVNSKLDPQVSFAEAYLSLQSVRNCLEHRDGIVSKIETRGGEAFTLSIPRIKLFYLRGTSEVEIEPGQRLDPGDDRAEVEVMMRLETRERLVTLGERITFTLAEFNEIAFACRFLGQQLSATLPKPKVAGT